jgi:lysozyme family protein
MASFSEAYKLTSAHEGKYVNDKTDRGGETYRGISRVHHPHWKGWQWIDAAREKAGFPRSLESNRSLQANVKSFFKQKYWDKFLGDVIVDQSVAIELYDTSVNMGSRRAGRFLQNGLNLLNRNQKNYNDLIVDGLIGQKSLDALNAYLNLDKNSIALTKLLNIQQGARYVNIMEEDSSQEKYARGWLKRA